jgi:ABC-type bacteriocin/lantibiotic exporter with double-glycine peptidase domain
MQIYGTQAHEESKAQGSLAGNRNHALAHHYVAGLKSTVPQVGGIAIVCVIALLADSISGFTRGMLVSYIYIFIRFTQNFSDAVRSGSSLVFYFPQFGQLADWWNTQGYSGIQKPNNALTSERPSAQIKTPIGWELRNVRFTYPGTSHEIIQSLDLTIQAGKTLVLMGPSGSGKSTLLGLLLGTIRPASGSIRVAYNQQAHDLEEAKGDLLSRVGYVGAESFLIEGTIYDNIVYGLKAPPSETDIHEALKKAECGFVLDLPKQLQHPITEQGQGLSMGQKQRLSLARALLRKPKALFLDEATANLDNDTEARLVETLAQLKGEVTIIAATHRQALLRISDQNLNFGGTSSDSNRA